MQISIEKNFVRELILKGNPEDSTEDTERKYDIKFDKIFTLDSRSFSILFKLNVNNSVEFDLSIKYECIFKTDEDITDDFKMSHFPNINAPAIGFPFLRSYISFLLMNSGFEPVLLPTINFTQFVKEPKSDGENSIIK